MLGQIDIMINNAALGAKGVEDMKHDDWQYVVKTNLFGYISCTKEAVKRMKKNNSGHIILVGSMSADEREEGSSIYVATKFAIQGFAEALRKEVNEDGIIVSLVEPGAVNTDMQSGTPEERNKKLKILKCFVPRILQLEFIIY